MQTLHFHAVVPKDRRLEIALPPEIPEGPVDMVLVLESAKEAQTTEARHGAMRTALERLRGVRAKTAGRQVRLSEAVIEERCSDD